MRKFAPVSVVVLAVALTPCVAAEAPPTLPSKIGYTFYLDGKRVGRADVRVIHDGDALRFESKLRVDNGPASIELSTRAEADPETFALRSFSCEGTKGGEPASSSVTVQGDSAFGLVTWGGEKSPRGRRVTPGPMVVWEDWAMELEILLARQQARELEPKTRGLLLASNFSTAKVLLGYSGEVLVESDHGSMTARKLLVAIQGGEPYESMIDPKLGIPVYIRFPGVKAEAFLDEFFGDNPVSRYAAASGPSPRR